MLLRPKWELADKLGVRFIKQPFTPTCNNEGVKRWSEIVLVVRTEIVDLKTI